MVLDGNINKNNIINLKINKLESINFAYRLQGFFEISDSNKLSEKQVQIIKDHLALVFDKQTPDINLEDDFKPKKGIAERYLHLLQDNKNDLNNIPKMMTSEEAEGKSTLFCAKVEPTEEPRFGLGKCNIKKNHQIKCSGLNNNTKIC